MGARGSGRTAALACVLGVATLAVGIGVAWGAKLKTESASTTVPPDEIRAATATCKQERKVVSGGFESVNFDSEFNLAGHLPYASFRPNGRAWTVAGEGFGSQAGTLIAYAYCWKQQRLKARTASAPVPAGGNATATAQCKQDEKVVAGGFDVPDFDPDNSGPFPYTSRKQGKRGWTASVDNYDDVDSATLVTHAYCREDKGVKSKSTSDEVGVPPETGTVTAKCKRGRRILSGGFDNPDYASSDGAQLLPFVSRKQGGRRWTVSAYNEGAENGTLTVYAYCEKKKKR